MREKVGNLNVGDKFVQEFMFHPINTPLRTVKGFQGDFVMCEAYNGTPIWLRKDEDVTVIFRNKDRR